MMKKLSGVKKIVFFINNLVAIALLVSIITPFIKPSTLSIAPVLSLLAPALIVINLLFMVFWIVIGFKKQFWLSGVILLVTFFIASSIYKFGSSTKNSEEGLRIMSYNVRVFNLFKWIKSEGTTSNMLQFIHDENPDILGVQEYFKSDKIQLKFPYNYVKIKNKSENVGLAIYSKLPIINKGSLDFKNTLNNAIFIDVLRNNDTLRIYNIHLESLNIQPDKEYFGQQNSDNLYKTTKRKFRVQEEQIDKINAHINNCKHKIIITSDMNNTAYSWTYKNLKGDLQDTFLKAGSKFGKTYNFKGFPLRIDFILADKSINIINHKNYKVKYSDHYPIMAILDL